MRTVLVLLVLAWVPHAALTVLLLIKLRRSRALNDAWSYSLRRQRVER